MKIINDYDSLITDLYATAFLCVLLFAESIFCVLSWVRI